MKRIFIIHGWEGSPNEPMHKWLKQKLSELGCEVIVPNMPNPGKPKINRWIGKLKEVVNKSDINTYFIGHSIGCQGILRYLETLDTNIKIGGAVFIAPWMKLDENTIKEEGEEIVTTAKPWMETPIDWDRVKSHTKKFVCILSDNDPYVPLTNKDLFQNNLDAEIIIEKNKGHFTEGDGVLSNETALKKLIEMMK